MSIYNVNFRRLALLLLPTMLRKPLLSAFAMAVVAPLINLYTRFLQFRDTEEYRLKHNGQVCYLRAVLNDRFDPIERRITIDGGMTGTTQVIIYQRELYKPLYVPVRSTGNAIILNRRGYGGADGFDFWIDVPQALYGQIDESVMCAVTNVYKLASKRYAINYV